MSKRSMNDAQVFDAMLEKGERSLGWTIARVPFSPAEVWPEMIRLRVSGELNGFPFRTSLFPDPAGPGMYFLLVNKKTQQGGKAAQGSTGRFLLRPDLEERPAELPEALESLLEDEEGLRAWYDALSEYTRREFGKWINGAKGAEARLRRCEQVAERLLAAMEGEREVPPVIAAAFRGRPKARDGWEKMTATQRRNELLAVFYYGSPEARAKRVAKLCNAAEKRVMSTK